MNNSKPGATSNSTRILARWGLGILLIAAMLVAAKLLPARECLKAALVWIQGLGAWGPVLFILIYVAACVLMVPGSLLTLGAGVIFGVARGLIYVSAGSTLGATAAFLVGRHLARDWVARKIESHPRFKTLDAAAAREGWRIVLLTRLSPVFPFNLLNYAFGLTRVSLKEYFLASWLGMLPGALMYVYLGSLAGDLAGLDHGVKSPRALKWTLGIVTVLVTLYLTRVAKRALAQKASA
ncbi:MAG: TVP38/TMEM64 family protein [Limisphaerales bacterium]